MSLTITLSKWAFALAACIFATGAFAQAARPTALPQDHDYQVVLRDYLATLTAADFALELKPLAFDEAWAAEAVIRFESPQRVRLGEVWTDNHPTRMAVQNLQIDLLVPVAGSAPLPDLTLRYRIGPGVGKPPKEESP